MSHRIGRINVVFLLVLLCVSFVDRPTIAQARRDSQASAQDGTGADSVRIRDLGVSPGVLSPGRLNAITDVDGVSVGHVTLIEGEDIRTGVTAILPHSGDLFENKVPAAVYVGNGFGKAAGFLQIQELGNIETPIVLTNTLSVGTAIEALVRWTLDQPNHESVRSVNAVVGETNDGYLNDIRGMHVTHEHVFEAIDRAADGIVEEGSVGAGTGTRAFGFKGGIGTSSRQLAIEQGGFTVGVLVQTNFGGLLTIDGRRIGETLIVNSAQGEVTSVNESPSKIVFGQIPFPDFESGSCMIVVATDAPLSDRNLERLARRAVLGLARTGGYMSNGSGDFVIAFSTAYTIADPSDTGSQTIELLDNSRMSPLFLAVVESTEEAVYNSLVQATTITGRDGNRSEAIPLDQLRELLR